MICHVDIWQTGSEEHVMKHLKFEEILPHASSDNIKTLLFAAYLANQKDAAFIVKNE